MYVKTHKTVLYYICSIHTVRLLYFSKADSGTGGSYTVVSKPLAKRWEPRGFSRVAAAFSSYDGDLSLPLGLAQGSLIFLSGCEGKLGVALESLQGRRDLT